MNGPDSLNHKAKVSQVDLGIKKDQISHIAQHLSCVLASTYMLYTKTQGFHWNVTGPHFFSLHKLSEEHYNDMADAIDTLAERIRSLGHVAPASYSWYAKLSRIAEKEDAGTTLDQLNDLLSDHETMSVLLKEGFEMAEGAGDHATADLFVQRMHEHEKAAWMLRATLSV